MALLEQGPSVSARTPSACTATGNHPGPCEIPARICFPSTLIVTEISAVYKRNRMGVQGLLRRLFPLPLPPQKALKSVWPLERGSATAATRSCLIWGGGLAANQSDV